MSNTFNRFLQGFTKTSGAQPLLGAPYIDPRLDRMDNLAALTRAAAMGFTPDTTKGITEFEGIVLYVGRPNQLMSPQQNPRTSVSPIGAAKANNAQYIIKCYVTTGPQSILLPVPPNFSKLSKKTNLELAFIEYPPFLYDRRLASTPRIPVVGDMVRLRYNNARQTDGVCVALLPENNFHALYSMDEKTSSIDQFDNIISNDVSDFSAADVPGRASPPNWNKRCINHGDPKYSASSLRTSDGIKKYIKSRSEFIRIPYDYNRPADWRGGLASYQQPAITPAIGWAHLIEDNEKNSYPIGDPISLIDAETLFINDIKAREKKISRLVTVPITQNQYDALISYYFDMKSVLYRGPDSIIDKINFGDCAGAARKFLEFGPTRKGVDQKIINQRRKYEAILFITPTGAPLPVISEGPLSLQAQSQQNYYTQRLMATTAPQASTAPGYAVSALQPEAAISSPHSSRLASWASISGGYKPKRRIS